MTRLRNAACNAAEIARAHSPNGESVSAAVRAGTFGHAIYSGTRVFVAAPGCLQRPEANCSGTRLFTAARGYL